MNDEWTVVEIVQGRFVEDQVIAFLVANGIAATSQGEALRQTHGFTLDGLGAVRILVPAEHAAAARALLDRVRAGELALAEDELPPDHVAE